MISIGLVGCGAVVHSNYAQTLIGREAYAVRCVCDTNSAQAESAAKLFGAEAVSLEELIDRVDAVVISTPPSTHSGLVRACLRTGRTILCEKPYMTTHQDALDVTREAQAIGASLYVAHFRRVFPQLALARELVTLGVIGGVVGFAASEGGRFTWKAVSNYTVRDPTGGVLWDTGSHTLDMALFASGVDRLSDFEVNEIEVERDREEPSHDFGARFTISTAELDIAGRLHVSRKEALPNIVRIRGSEGEIVFVTGMDDRVRLSTPKGSMIVNASRSYEDLLECLDLELRAVLHGEGAEPFAADRFVGQIKLIEALARA